MNYLYQSLTILLSAAWMNVSAASSHTTATGGLQENSVQKAVQTLSSNIAYQDETVRFTVITDGLIRMEYEPDGKFTDAKTFIAVKRSYPVCQFRVTKGNWIQVSTSKMTLRYKRGSGPFNPKNLIIKSTKNLSEKFTWTPGTIQKNNLKGTYRTLDRYCGNLLDNKPDQPMPIEDGLLATDGWTLIDDSKGFTFDGDPDFEWLKTRNNSQKAQDFYFLAYGHNYKQALKDFTLLSGKIPMPPRFAFGYWWSRYWMYSDKEIRQLVKQFQAHSVPIDVMVIDIDWHYRDKERGGWTGWTWNKALFPSYPKLLDYLGQQELKTTINLHPADGVRHFEEGYPLVARQLGIDPASKKDIPWVSSDKPFMKAVFDNILDPMTRNGVDFWWLDWQQQLKDSKYPQLSNTWWLNYVFYTHSKKLSRHRPLIYHRWGGLGNHRYQIGFSGDSWINWKSLDFQPYFNSTASNVLYGYWSHDIGGHDNNNKIDPEMYVRWMQFGALSPIMRTHSTKSATLRKEPWNFDASTCANLCNIIRTRYRLAPYIYTMARKAYDEGLSICRPLYYDNPEATEAYSFRNQYMFGDNILVAPITQPMSGTYSSQTLWLPEGQWFEATTGTMEKGGQTITRDFAIDEYPVYVKAGSILPFYGDSVRNLQHNDESVTLDVFPGDKGEFTLYEDNGDDQNYDTQYATTHLTNSREGNRQTITIGARKGHYEDMPAKRHFRVKLINQIAPVQVTVNGKQVPYTYDGDDFAVLIDVPETGCNTTKVISLTFPETSVNLDAVKGRAHRLAKTLEALKYRQADIIFIDELALLGSISESAMYFPERHEQLIQQFNSLYQQLPELLKRQKLNTETSEWFLKQVDWKNK
ncbi:MAG: TIM-barrel domain-containing protein [Prevotella sp.]|jgi:alpha-glucosidase (family GH31 glycosyl hydrolase)